MIDSVAAIEKIESMADLTPYEKMTLVSMVASIRFLLDHRFIENEIDIDSVIAAFVGGR